MFHKRLMALAAVAALLAGCGATAPKAASSTGSGAEAQAQADSPAVAKADLAPAAPLAGSGRDPSDCLPSAGQTWSKLRKACVQVFDVADIRLTDPDNPALAVYVLFSPDKKVAEMFSASFPDGSVMMAATRGGNSYFANMGRVLLLNARPPPWRAFFFRHRNTFTPCPHPPMPKAPSACSRGWSLSGSAPACTRAPTRRCTSFRK